MALNLDGFNPLTCSLVPWLEPVYVAGGSLSSNRRRDLPWGMHPRQSFMADPDWDSPGFQLRYADVFSSNYIAELFCQLAWVQDYVDPTAIELPFAEPPFEVPDVLIHCTTARAAKVWPFGYWRQVLDVANDCGWSVGIVGSPPAAQKEAYNSGDGEESLLQSTNLIDLRGKTSLMQLSGACRQAKAVISVDAGPSTLPLQSERLPTQLLEMMTTVWEPARCVYGCLVVAMSRAASALLHAQLVLKIDSAMTIVWSMAIPVWQRFSQIK